MEKKYSIYNLRLLFQKAFGDTKREEESAGLSLRDFLGQRFSVAYQEPGQSKKTPALVLEGIDRDMLIFQHPQNGQTVILNRQTIKKMKRLKAPEVLA